MNKVYNKKEYQKLERYGYYPEKITFLLENFGRGKKNLDVGCGIGFIGEILLNQGYKVYGIDISSKRLKIAKKKGLIVKRIDVEKSKITFPKNSFDAIILGDILEHVFDTDALLQKCWQLLKTNGKIIITTPNVTSIGRRLLFGINPFLEYSSMVRINNVPVSRSYQILHCEKPRRTIESKWF